MQKPCELIAAIKHFVLEIKGGPLTGTYKFEQFHFHWGTDDKEGSEHTLNGQLFSSEVYLTS